MQDKAWDKAIAAVTPVLKDPLWAGRAHHVCGKAYAGLGNNEEAVANLLVATQTADSVYIRAEASHDLGGVYETMKQPMKAYECYRAAVANDAFWDYLSSDMAAVRCLLDAGRPLEAAQAALEVEVRLLDYKATYPAELVRGDLRQCEELLDKCEAALAKEKAGQPAESNPGH